MAIAAGESTLDWTTVATESAGQLPIVLVLILTVLILTYAGSVAFFLM
jgi:hypothetical protein